MICAEIYGTVCYKGGCTANACHIIIACIRNSVHAVYYAEGIVVSILHIIKSCLELICILSSLIGSGIGNNGSTNLGELDFNSGVLRSVGILGIVTEHNDCGLGEKFGDGAVLYVEIKFHKGILIAKDGGERECEIGHKIHIVYTFGIYTVNVNIVLYVVCKLVNVKVAEVIPKVLALPNCGIAHIVLDGLCVNGIVLINNHLKHFVAGIAVLILDIVLIASAIVACDSVLGAAVIPACLPSTVSHFDHILIYLIRAVCGSIDIVVNVGNGTRNGDAGIADRYKHIRSKLTYSALYYGSLGNKSLGSLNGVVLLGGCGNCDNGVDRDIAGHGYKTVFINAYHVGVRNRPGHLGVLSTGNTSGNLYGLALLDLRRGGRHFDFYYIRRGSNGILRIVGIGIVGNIVVIVFVVIVVVRPFTSRECRQEHHTNKDECQQTDN